MDAHAFELGKQAAKMIIRSVRICVGKPGSKEEITKALREGRHSNSSPPWQKGRKVKRK